MIARIWRGWTTPENADEYEELLRSIIILRIESLQVPGYQGIEVLRRQEGDEVAFVTVMHDSVGSEAFAQAVRRNRAALRDLAGDPLRMICLMVVK
jgi:antibiotic biosynthesis monooxygenase (ABM) superfamily enzyme